MRVYRWVKAGHRCARAAVLALAVCSAGSNAAGAVSLSVRIYGMPEVTYLECAVTPDLNDPSSWVMQVSMPVDNRAAGEVRIQIGRYDTGVPVTCVITEDSAFISGYRQAIRVTWPGTGCLATARGSWSTLSIIAKGPGCP